MSKKGELEMAKRGLFRVRATYDIKKREVVALNLDDIIKAERKWDRLRKRG